MCRHEWARGVFRCRATAEPLRDAADFAAVVDPFRHFRRPLCSPGVTAVGGPLHCAARRQPRDAFARTHRNPRDVTEDLPWKQASSPLREGRPLEVRWNEVLLSDRHGG